MQPVIALDTSPVTARPTGVGRYVLELVRHLADGRSVRLVPVGPEVPLARERGLPSIATGPLAGSTGARVRRLWFESARLPALLRRAGAHAYHGAAFRLPRVRPDVPEVVTIPDLSPFVLPRAQSPLRTAHLRSQVRRAVARAAGVIAISRSIAQDLAQQFPGVAARVRVVYLGVSDVFRAAAPTPPERPTFVTVATLERRKNLARLLAAFRGVAERLPAATLRLIGQADNDLGRVRAAIAAHRLDGRVAIEGYLPDDAVAAAYAGATAVVYPSLYEGFGLPIAEAMAAGAPVITSNRGAMREVAGDAAVLVDPADEGGLARAMLALAESASRREELAARGRARAAAFTWERCAREHAELYREVASRGA